MNAGVTDEFGALEKFSAVSRWVRARTALPLWWAEWYVEPVDAAWSDAHQRAVRTAAMIEIVKSGVDTHYIGTLGPWWGLRHMPVDRYWKRWWWSATALADDTAGLRTMVCARHTARANCRSRDSMGARAAADAGGRQHAGQAGDRIARWSAGESCAL
jgi:hypothetical protein